MTDDRSLERAARSWLEAGPTRAPDQVILLALARIEATPQDRVWPFPQRHERLGQTYRLATGLAVMAAIVLGGVLLLQRGPSPGPAISPSPSPTASVPPSASPSASATSDAGGPPTLTTTFISPRNGFSIQYPADWTVTPATAPWETGVVNQWGSPALDEIKGATARFVGTSQPLPAGQTADQWLAAFAASACITPESSWARVPVGQTTGLIDSDGCEAPDPPRGKGGPIFDAVVIFGGRVYDFSMDGELSHSDFVSFLSAVTLDPTTAVDASPSP